MAISKVTSGGIADGTLSVEDIADDAVTAAKLANSINTDIATGVTGNTTANAALPKAGGAMTGAITTNSTFDGVDIATRDGVLTSTTATAAAALPKAGGAMTGTITNLRSTGIDDNADALAMTITSSENVGIGIVPEAWHSSYVGLQVGLSTSLMANTSAAGNITWFGNNFYYDGTRKYINTDEATVYEQGEGNHKFNVTASGSADSAITWTTGFEVLNGGKARAKNGLLFGTDTATANTLDDYEEGSWSPSIEAANGNAANFTVGSAMYTKIGRQVNVTAYIHTIDLTAMTSGSYILLKGLPYTSQDYADFAMGYRDAGYSNSVIVGGYVQSGVTFCYLMHGGGGEAQQGSTFTFSKCMINITYPST